MASRKVTKTKTKTKKKTAKTSPDFFSVEHDFIIMVGGGFVVIVLVLMAMAR